MRLNKKIIAGLVYCLASTGLAQEDIFSLSLEELSRINVSIATGSPKPIASAPAGTSVVTAEEIAVMGAQTLDEVLETIPGVHVSRGSFSYAPRYFIRGIVSAYNPQTLMLINGVPMTSLFLGDRGERVPNQHSIPIKTIERVEVIRGPGSALYGADAFAGVINVITKGADDIDGTELSASWGSFDTSRASVLHAVHMEDFKASVALSQLRTKGDNEAIIESDLQTVLDPTLASPISLAPAAASTSVKYFDIRTDMELKDWRWRLSWMSATDVGSGQGVGEALDPDSRAELYRGTSDLSWHNDDLLQDWEIDAQLSYVYSEQKVPNGLLLYPAGANFGLGGFPDGVRTKPELAEENARANLSFLYRGLARHQLTLGMGYHWADLFESSDEANNFINVLSPFGLQLQPRGELVDVSDTSEVFQPEESRQSHYVFVQDEWQFAQRWEMTTGLRFDDYSDISSAVSPRVALVWSTTKAFTSKLLYGEAFRAPAFFELGANSNPVALGNSDLDPESLRNMELAFDWRPDADWHYAVNFYHWRIRNYIDFVADAGVGTFTAQNAGKIHGAGAEMELRHQLGAGLQWMANYSYQRTKNTETREPLGFAPSHQGYFRVAWEFLPRWQLTPQLFWVGEREHAAGDTRDALEGYASVDVTLRKQWSGDIEMALISRNLFNADIREPSRGARPGQPFASIENDLPQQGRSIALELSASW